MFNVLREARYRNLFIAQVLALLGTGLLTVALGLLAYDIAGADAGAVLGTALTIKMVAYVGVAPVIAAVVNRLPAKAVLVGADLIRLGIAVSLPFLTDVWQIYLLVFVLQSASATVTPAFQSLIPLVLPDERQYTKALSLSRLAYDLESLVSPTLAAALLTLISFHWLFGGTVVGFLASAALVVSVAVPQPKPAPQTGGIYARTTRGTRIYLKTPRLRGLLALTLATAAAGAMVIVNTVVYVRTVLGRGADDVALALAAFGGGSMAAALVLPRVLDRVEDRPVMLAAAGLLVAALLALAMQAFSAVLDPWAALLAGWAILGVGYSAVMTPSGRLLRRSANPEDRSALFAAQFALSHGCWLVTYLVAGQLGAWAGMGWTMFALAALAALGVVVALVTWPRRDPQTLEHDHADLPPDHPHLAGARQAHAHDYVIDDLHHAWPRG